MGGGARIAGQCVSGWACGAWGQVQRAGQKGSGPCEAATAAEKSNCERLLAANARATPQLSLASPAAAATHLHNIVPPAPDAAVTVLRGADPPPGSISTQHMGTCHIQKAVD